MQSAASTQSTQSTQSFVEQATRLTSELASEVVRIVTRGIADEFSDRVAPASRPLARGPSSAAPQATSSPGTSGDAVPRSDRESGRRSPEAIDELGRRFALFVRDNPGLRIEQINKRLETTTADLALPIRKLVAQAAISAQGGRRATRYFVGKSFVSTVLDQGRRASSAAPAHRAKAGAPVEPPAPARLAREARAAEPATPEEVTRSTRRARSAEARRMKTKSTRARSRRPARSAGSAKRPGSAKKARHAKRARPGTADSARVAQDA